MNVEVRNKRVTKVPKVMKPGTLSTPETIHARHVMKALAKLKQTGKPAEALALIKLQRGTP